MIYRAADPALYAAVRELRLAAGAPWFTGEWDLNLVGVRRPWGDGREASDLFDDAIALAYTLAGAPIVEVFRATTDPGRAYLGAPMRPDGTAILVPGHYPGSHRLGRHKGYPALVQAGTLRVWRDATKDHRYDVGPVHAAPPSCGINIHAAADDVAGMVSARVGRWSAGCQVLQRRSALARLVAAAEGQRGAGLGDRVSYTLVVAEGAHREAAYTVLGAAPA
jgi:hypothetical protein